MAGVRVYMHYDGRYFTLCPDDGRGDVVVPMPEYHPSPSSDYNRLREAVEILERAKRPEGAVT